MVAQLAAEDRGQQLRIQGTHPESREIAHGLLLFAPWAKDRPPFGADQLEILGLLHSRSLYLLLFGFSCWAEFRSRRMTCSLARGVQGGRYLSLVQNEAQSFVGMGLGGQMKLLASGPGLIDRETQHAPHRLQPSRLQLLDGLLSLVQLGGSFSDA